MHDPASLHVLGGSVEEGVAGRGDELGMGGEDKGRQRGKAAVSAMREGKVCKSVGVVNEGERNYIMANLTIIICLAIFNRLLSFTEVMLRIRVTATSHIIAALTMQPRCQVKLTFQVNTYVRTYVHTQGSQ